MSGKYRVEKPAVHDLFTDDELLKNGAPEATDAVAVLVLHGVGQQSTFDTLERAAEGIVGTPPSRPRVACEVRIGNERFTRLETSTPDGRPLHLYEAYWAPLTEGQVTLPDVMRFFWSAGYNGLWNSFKKFHRWLFDDFRELGRTHWGTTLSLLFALLVMGSLVLLNTFTVTLGTLQALETGPEWLTAALVDDFTAIILMFCAIAASFVCVLAACGAQKPRRCVLPLASRLGFYYFFYTAGSLVAVAITMLLAIGYHRQPWYWLPQGAFITLWTVGGLLAAALICVVAASATRNIRAVAVSLGLAALLIAVAAVVVQIVAHRGNGAQTIFQDVAPWFLGLGFARITPAWLQTAAAWIADRWVLVWIALALLSRRIRNTIVQYAGDVAAYVTAQSLDRFNDVREKVKECVRKPAEALYRARDGERFLYGDVIVVGHSLGSVIAYDTLNRLLNTDDAIKARLQVRRRTAALITFGSPLDKTAFIFASNSTAKGAGRASLAATVQPLVAHTDTQNIEWINIHSMLDIISGSLEFYGKDRVRNIADYDALTPLAAHNEYWGNSLLWQRVGMAIDRQQGKYDPCSREVTADRRQDVA